MAANLEEIRTLIHENRFDEARQLLEQIKHPKQAKWLAELDAREAAYESQFSLDASEAPVPYQRGKQKAPRTLDEVDTPKPSPNYLLILLRVLVGGLVAMLLVPALMIFFDTQGAHFSDYLMQQALIDNPSNPATSQFFLRIVFFAFLSATSFAYIARFIAGGRGILAGTYYSILMILVYLIWHFGSFYFGAEQSLAISDPALIQAYSDYVARIPNISFLALATCAMFSLSIVFFLGAASNKEYDAMMLEINHTGEYKQSRRFGHFGRHKSSSGIGFNKSAK